MRWVRLGRRGETEGRGKVKSRGATEGKRNEDQRVAPATDQTKQCVNQQRAKEAKEGEDGRQDSSAE